MNDIAFGDMWSLVHLTAGILTCYIISLILHSPRYSWVVVPIAVLLHQVWEVFENTQPGIEMWHSLGYVDYVGDSVLNTIGDTFFFTLGCAVGVNGFRHSVQ